MTAVFGKIEPTKEVEVKTVFGSPRVEPKIQIPQPLNAQVSNVKFGTTDPVNPRR